VPRSQGQADARAPLPDATTFDVLLRSHVSTAANEVAVRERHRGLWRDLTWASLGESVSAAEVMLHNLGITDGAQISVVGRPSLQWLIAELAALRVGASVYAISDRSLASAVGRLRTVSDLRAVLVVHADGRRRDAMADEIKRALHDRVAGTLIEGVRVTSGGDPALSAMGRSDTAAAAAKLVVPSAGTSADFRWVDLDQATVIARWGAFLDWSGVERGDRIVAGGTLDFWANRLALLTSLLVRRAIVHFNDDGVADQRTRAQVRPTVTWSTARDWGTLADLISAEYAGAGRIARGIYMVAERRNSRSAGRVLRASIVRPMLRQAGLSAIRIAWALGDRLSDATASRWESWGIPLVECYGEAELGGMVGLRLCTGSAGARLFQFIDPAAVPAGPPQALDERFGVVAMPVGGATQEKRGDAAIVSGADVIAIVPEASEASGCADALVRLALFEAAVRESPYVREAVAFADDRQTDVLIEPNVPGLLTWARERQLQFLSTDRLLEMNEVQDLFAGLLALAQRPDLAPLGKVIVVPDLAQTQVGSLVSCSGRPRRAAIARSYLTPAAPSTLVPDTSS
jgi:long-chain acyl-CoA synthetase